MIVLPAVLWAAGLQNQTVAAERDPILDAPARPWAAKQMLPEVALSNFCQKNGLKWRIDGLTLKGSVTTELQNVTVREGLRRIVGQFVPPREWTLESGVVVIRLKYPIVTLKTAGRSLREFMAGVAAQSKLEIEIDDEVQSTLAEAVFEDIPYPAVLNAIATMARPPIDWEMREGKIVILPKANPLVAEIADDSGHPGRVDRIVTNEAGNLIAASDDSEVVILWEAAGTPRLHFRGKVARNGFTGPKSVLAGFRNEVYEIALDRNPRLLRKFTSKVIDLAYAPGPSILAVSLEGGIVSMLDVKTGAELRGARFRHSRYRVAIRPAGDRLAICPIGLGETQQASKALTVLGSDLGILETKTMAGEASDLGFAPNGAWLAAATNPGVLSVWNVDRPNSEARALFAPKDGATLPEAAIGFAPDQPILYATTAGAGLTAYDLRTETSRRMNLSGGRTYAFQYAALCVRPRGLGMVASSGSNVGIDKLATFSAGGQFIRPLTGNASRVSRVQFTPDGLSLLVGEVDGFRWWDLDLLRRPEFRSAQSWEPLPMPTPVPGAKIPPQTVLSIAPGGAAYEWLNPRDHAPLARLVLRGSTRSSRMEVAGDGNALAFDIDSRTLEVWQPYSLRIAFRATIDKGWITSFGLSHDGRFLAAAVAGEKPGLYLWDTYVGGSGMRSIALTRWPSSDAVSFARQKPLLAYEADDSVKIFDLATGQDVFSQPGSRPRLSENGKVLGYLRGDQLHIVDTTFGARSLPPIRGVQDFWIMPDCRSVAAIANERSMALFASLETGEVVRCRGASGLFSSAARSPTGDLLAAGCVDGQVRLYSPSGTLLAQLRGEGPEGFMVSLPNNYYMATPSTAQRVRFKVGQNYLSFDQFDARLNRPDLVMKTIGRTPEPKVQVAVNAFEMRVKKLGLDPAALGHETHFPEQPELLTPPPAQTTNDRATLKFRFKDVRLPLKRWSLVVNGVPEVGPFGEGFKNAAREQVVERTIRLNAGHNFCEVSCMNEQGASSLKVKFDIVSNRPKKQLPNLLVAAIGVSTWTLDGMQRLRFASKDANDMAFAFGEQGKWIVENGQRQKGWGKGAPAFEEVRLLRLRDEKATRENILSLASFFAASQPDDVVVLFLSGHGVAPNQSYAYLCYGSKRSDLAGTAVSATEIELLLDGIPSRNRLLLLDTCNAGDTEAEPLGPDAKRPSMEEFPADYVFKVDPGMKGLPTGLSETMELMKTAFSNLERGAGAFVIAASTGGSQAQESDRLKNGLFTRCLLDGLSMMRADRSPKDGRVTVRELANFILAEVPRRSQGSQTATLRRANAGLDFRVR